MHSLTHSTGEEEEEEDAVPGGRERKRERERKETEREERERDCYLNSIAPKENTDCCCGVRMRRE